jgi:flagellar biogenesis protein FliO
MADGPSTAELLVRLVFSLGLVLGLLVLAAKVARRNGRALRLPGMGAKREATIKVLERQSLTRNASLAVVQVGERTMVVGITEQKVSLLADDVAGEPEPEPLVAVPAAASDAVEVDTGSTTTTGSPDSEPLPSPVTQISALREAKGMLPLAPGTGALDATATPERPPRMSFVDALREMTVRSA